MVATSRPATRSWRWHGAAALASAVFPAVFVQATLVANWYVDHPVAVPGDDSPGGGNMGNVIEVPIFAVAAIACLLFQLLWGITTFRTWKGAATKDLPVISTVLQGAASLVALPVAATLPYNWADVTTLVAADLVALSVALRPRWSRRTLTPRLAKSQEREVDRAGDGCGGAETSATRRYRQAQPRDTDETGLPSSH